MGYDFHFIYFDAHYDLRDSYEGSKFSHASTVRRIYELQIPITGIGIRAGDIEEYSFAKEKSLTIVHSYEIKKDFSIIEKSLKKIKEELIHISFDFDFFDGFYLPSLGTPEPSGFNLDDFLKILKLIKTLDKKIIAVDFVEFSPINSLPQSSYLAAAVIFKTISMLRNSFFTI